MRILHLSHEGLPDWRIEKSALSALKFGHQVMFGGVNSTNYDRRVFSNIYVIDWTLGARFGLPFHWNSVKKQVKQVVEQSKPDVVHAHNIFAAKMISELGIPLVYDDHEYWSVYARALAEKPIPYKKSAKLIADDISPVKKIIRKVVWNTILRHRAVKLWTKWEYDLVSSVPTIVTTRRAAEELKALVKNNSNLLFVVPSFPMKCEVKTKKPTFHSILSSVYAGGDTLGNGTQPHRNMDGLIDVFNNNNIGSLTLIGVKGESSKKVKCLGFLSREAMYDEMFKHSIGLMPNRRHWLHQYRDANKPYEYAHAGLLVMFVSSYESVISNFNGNCCTFEDYDEMTQQLLYFKSNLEELYNRRLRTLAYARNELIWENYERNILCAYRHA